MEQTRIIPAVVAQHADEAAFLWLQRESAVTAPQYSLSELAKLDGRVEAHVDGLRIAGSAGWPVCEECWKWEEPGEVFVGAVLAFDAGDRTRIQQVLKIVTDQPVMAAGLVSALGWLPFAQAQAHARTLLGSDVAVLRRTGLAAFAIHRENPGDVRLRAGFQDPDSALRALGLKAVGELGRLDFLAEVTRSVAAADPEVRYWAAWTVALLSGSPQALSVLRSVAEAPGPRQEQALQMAMRRLSPPEAIAWQQKLSRRAGLLRLGITAAGHLGDPELIPWLIEQMKVPAQSRVAGEAFSTISGMGLDDQKLEAKPPEGFQSGPTDNPEDENVAMDPDENLPWPDPALVAKWWSQHQGEFAVGTRYLCGKPMTPDWLKQVLRDGYQRQRAAAALELAIRNPGQPLFNVKAPGFRQIELLGKPGPPLR